MTLHRLVHVVRLRVRSLFDSSRVEADLSDELRFHLEERARELVARGMNERDARDAALRAFGGLEQRKEEMRDARKVAWIRDALRDTGFAFRLMRRSPGFTAVAVVSLALGIGANTAMFAVLDVLALRTLPVSRPERLVFVDNHIGNMSLAQFERFRDLSTVYSGMSASWSIDRFNLALHRPDGGLDTDPSQVRIGLASANYFRTLGIDAARGRTFVDDEDRTGSVESVAVISDAFWRRRFGAAQDVIGRQFRLSGVSFTVIGVAPRGFAGEWIGMPTDVWVPFAMASQVMPEVPGGPERFPRRVIARLAPDVTIEQARAASDVLYRQLLNDEAGAKLTPEHAAEIARAHASVEPAAKGHSPQRREFAQPLAIVAAGVGVLLLVACANLANLLMARSAARQREMAVRLAIGAGRGRLVRQVMTESVVLAAAGSVLGVLVAVWAENILSALVASAPVALGGQSSDVLILDLRFDWRSLVFTTVLCLLTAVFFGIAPAVFSSRTPVAGGLAESSSRVVAGGARFGPSTALVAMQVSLSLLLLVGAGLFQRTLANLRAENLGVEREHELLVWTVPGQTGRQADDMAELWHTIQVRLSALPGVISAAASNQAVLSGNIMPPGNLSLPLTVDGEPPKRSTTPGFRSFITPGFFATLGVPFVAGRDFTERDTDAAPKVVILNESMAKYFFGDRNPVGRTVRFAGTTAIPTEIVGVTKDFVKGSPRAGAQAEFATYFPYRDKEALNRGAQTRLRVMLVVLRTAGDPLAMAQHVREELAAIDPALPVLRINTTEQQLDDVLARDRLIAALSTWLGALAVILASVGLFGLVSYRAARRTNEIGVRLALGATRAAVLGMILRESGRLVLVGLVVGVVSALALARFVSSRLYGVSATDPWTIAGACLLLLALAALAAFVPARRASRVDPMVALRCD